MKNKIVIYIKAEGKSPGKSSRQRDKTKEIGAVKFNKRARKGKKGRDGESGRELKLAACLVVFFNFPLWLFPLSFSFSTELSCSCPRSLRRVHSRCYVPFAFVIASFASFSPHKKKTGICTTPGIYNSRKAICCPEEKFPDKDKEVPLDPKVERD